MDRPYEKPSKRAVTFTRTADARVPYEAEVDGARWTVRIDEFPAEPSLYTLLVDGVAAEALMEWPQAWTRPDEA